MAVRIYLEESARRFETGVRELEVLGGFKLAGDGVPVRWSEAGVPGISWDGSRALVRAKRSFFAGWACCGSAWQAARLPLNRPRRRCSAAWAPVLTFPVMQ